jgi:D-sedoheptulose 7-phosphate isomerase
VNTISKQIQDSIELKSKILNDPSMLKLIDEIIQIISTAFKQNKKVLFCGNGGSAADAQHLAAEFSGRYYYDRPPLYAEALHVNSSYMTAVANDYSFEMVYARMIEAMASENDVLIALSTSGNSTNVLKAVETARNKKMIVISFTGDTGGKLKSISNYLVNIPSNDTPRIQECHMLIGHIICKEVEEIMFPKK